VANAIKQHLIDPEICIRCYTCEATCPIDAIEHNDDNVVVNADGDSDSNQLEALDDDIAALLADAHSGAGGRTVAPASASKPTVNLFRRDKPLTATVQGNYRLTAEGADSDVRHIILDLGQQHVPVLEGQSIGVIPPGDDKPLPRLYSISSPRDGERRNYNNLSLTVKRDEGGRCSNYLCDLKKGDTVSLTGPFGSTFLMPNDPAAHLLMICTGTGSAPFRAFTMQRERSYPDSSGGMTLVFGARTPESLPYFGPLKKVPDSLLDKHLVFSREQGQPKRYVQDELRDMGDSITTLLEDPSCHIYICGLRDMEAGVEQAFTDIASGASKDWQQIRATLREQGRYHVETY